MESDWTKVLGFPGYRVYKQDIDEEHKQLKLWIRRKRGNRSMICSGCGVRIEGGKGAPVAQQVALQ
jgi:hypothetical protein